MEYLQYYKNSLLSGFTSKVLNLVISGISSIHVRYCPNGGQEKIVLNLVISGIPSIL